MISVIMSVFKEPLPWVSAALESIQNQSFPDWELIVVVDNPSLCDEVRAYLETKRENDQRIRLLYNEKNMGLALSLNRGIEAAQGEWIARMDADDISLPERFEKELFFAETSGADMVCTNRVMIDENGETIGKGAPLAKDIAAVLPLENPVVHPSVLMKSEAVRSVGGYRAFKRSQDYDLWLRFLSSGKKMAGLDEKLIHYRVSTQNLSHRNRLEQYYINRYQRKLYEERRKKGGKDSFSEEHLANYLKKKKITEKKNERAIKCFSHIEEVKEKLGRREFSAVFSTFAGFFAMPSVFCSVALNFLKKK